MKKGESLQVAFIGAGHAGRLFSGMDMAGFDVHSVGYASRSGSHAVAVGRNRRELDWGQGFPGKDGYKDLLTHTKPDVVVVAVPPYRTVDMTRAVLDATPVETALFVAKPVGLIPAEVQEVADTIRDTGRVVGVDHQWVTSPTMGFFQQQVEERLEAGRDITTVGGRWHGNSFYTAGGWWRKMAESGGPLIEQGHPLHLIQHVLTEPLGKLQVGQKAPQLYYGIPGELPEDVDPARIGEVYVPTQVQAQLIFESGTAVFLKASGIHTGPEIVDVMVEFDDETVVGFEKRRAYVQKGDKITEETTDYPGPAFTNLMGHFLRAVTTGEKNNVPVDYNAGSQSLKVAYEVMQRAQTSFKPLFR